MKKFNLDDYCKDTFNLSPEEIDGWYPLDVEEMLEMVHAHYLEQIIDIFEGE